VQAAEMFINKRYFVYFKKNSVQASKKELLPIKRILRYTYK